MSDQEYPVEFKEVVQNIVKYLSYKERFAYHSKEDIAQEIWGFCLDAVRRYDGKRNLYNFLLTHVKNRLKSFKRDTYFRYDCPCKLCTFKEDGKTDHKNKKHCKVYLKWLEVNNRKKNLASPIFTDFFRNENLVVAGAGHEEAVDRKDFFDMVDRNLPVLLRESYLKMLSGVHVPIKDQELVISFIKGLIKE